MGKKIKNRIYPEKTVNDYKELVQLATKEFSDDIAFTVKDSSKNTHDVTFQEFNGDIKALGTSLLELGFRRKKIALISAARYEWCTSYFAISNSSNIIVPLDHLLPYNELTTLITESEVEAIIFDKKYMDLIKEIIKNGNTSLKYYICMDLATDENDILSYSNLLQKGHKLLENGNTKYDAIKINKNELSILLYTSGTTSKPKAVMLSQYNICSNISAMTTLIKHEPNDSVLVFLPLHHTLACTASFLFCYYTGFHIYFADSVKDVGKNMKEYQVSGLVCVPALLDIMYKQIIRGVKKSNKYVIFRIMCVISNILRFFKIDLRRKFFKEVLDNLGGNLRIIIYGSASSNNKKAIKLFNTIGIDMLQGYGLTETSPVISCESDKYHYQIGSCGFPLHNLEVKIDKPDASGEGEILVKGPNVMLGYYKDETATKQAMTGSWFHTGDLGHIDKKGYLFVTGRIKDVIVLSNGKNVYPQELEDLLNKIEGILESFVYEKEEKICAKLVYSKDFLTSQKITEQELHDKISEEIKILNKHLPIYKYIREFTLVDTPLEKTTTQKIKRNEEMKKILSK